MRDKFDITELSEALDVSRSGYHASKTRPPSPRDKANQEIIKEMHSVHSHRHTHAYGSPRMTFHLRDNGFSCSENRVARLMRQEDIRARPRKPFRPKTTSPDHAAHPSPNLLASSSPSAEPGQYIVSDITYIPTAEGWIYLAVVVDLFSRYILGWRLSESLDASLVTGSLRQASSTGMLRSNTIFHSDRGCQYTATTTRQWLRMNGIRQSMSAKGYCYDNAYAESIFASLKAEAIPASGQFPSKQAARLAIFDYIETFYNSRRLHRSLGFMSPQNYLKIYFQKTNASLN